MINFVPLSDCISLFGGGTPSKQVPEYWNGKIPWASVKDLKSTRLKRTEDSITELGLKNSSSKLVKAGTIIIATRMAVGKAAIADIDVAINQDLKAIVCKENIDVQYLFYFLSSSENEFDKVSSGATVKGIKLNHILDLKIPLPPLAEQKQIAAILDAADSLRQKDQQLVEHYAALSQSLFLEMFGDPVSNPLRWEILCLGDLGDWHSGGTPDRKNADYFIGDIPWITSGELNNTYIKDSKEHISEIAIKNSAAKIIDKGSLLLGMYDTAALKSSITQEIVSCNQAIAFSKLNAIKANTVFVYSMIQYGKEHYRRLQRGVRQQNLNLTMIKEIRVIHPPISLQNQFAERIAIIEKQKQQAQANLKKSEALFNSLLQRAFTGELTANKAA